MTFTFLKQPKAGDLCPAWEADLKLPKVFLHWLTHHLSNTMMLLSSCPFTSNVNHSTDGQNEFTWLVLTCLVCIAAAIFSSAQTEVLLLCFSWTTSQHNQRLIPSLFGDNRPPSLGPERTEGPHKPFLLRKTKAMPTHWPTCVITLSK